MPNTPQEAARGPLRVAFLGAGEIATTHLAAVRRLPDVSVAAVCDLDESRARAFQHLGGIAESFGDLDAMLAKVAPDVVHVLLPPSAHASAAERCLAAGSHVFVEKPFCVTVEECQRVEEAAARAGRQVGVDHNLAFMPAFVKALDAVRGCRLGAVEHMSVTYNLPMPVVHTGPHRHWMFAATENLMLELGPHPVSTVCRVLGRVEQAATAVSGEMTLGNGTRFFRSWQSGLVCERGTAQLMLAVGAGYYTVLVHLIGEDGEAVVDLRRNTVTVTEKSPHIRSDDYVAVRRRAKSLATQATRNMLEYGLGAAGVRREYSVQIASVVNSLASFYDAVRAGRAPVVGGAQGTAVIEACYKIVESALRFAEQAGAGLSHTDNVVVIGGAGFIGGYVTARLRAAGAAVSVVSRSAGRRRGDDPGVVYRDGDVTDAARMSELIAGASAVYDLSMGGGATWEVVERLAVGGARNVARACLEHGVRRLIYVSSISALNLGGKGTIDEKTPNDGNSPSRGLYSRGKSMAERALLEMHAAEALPVVILRPGVVLGRGGQLLHGAFGEQASDTCVLGWGPGIYPLPCVLVDDVAKALVAAATAPGVEGLTFNLAGDVRPTAAEYVAEVRRRSKRNFRFFPRRVAGLQGGELLRWGVKRLANKPGNVLQPGGDVKSMTMSAQLDCSLAKRLLGWARSCADRDEFFRQAIDPHLKPIPAGDLRLETVS